MPGEAEGRGSLPDRAKNFKQPRQWGQPAGSASGPMGDGPGPWGTGHLLVRTKGNV